MMGTILLSHKLGLGVRINIAIIGFGLGVVGMGCCGVVSYIHLQSVRQDIIRLEKSMSSRH